MSTRIFYNSQSEAIQLGRRVGIGGEGTVYEIQNRSDLVAKIYHEPPPPEKAEANAPPDPNLRRLEEQIEALRKQLDALGRDRKDG